MELTAVAAAEGATTVLTVEGSIDLASRGVLLDAARAALADAVTLVLDLAGVTFLDSTGIGAIVSIAGDADDKGVEFAIRSPSARVARLLDVTGLADMWTTLPPRA